MDASERALPCPPVQPANKHIRGVSCLRLSTLRYVLASLPVGLHRDPQRQDCVLSGPAVFKFGQLCQGLPGGTAILTLPGCT